MRLSQFLFGVCLFLCLIYLIAGMILSEPAGFGFIVGGFIVLCILSLADLATQLNKQEVKTNGNN